MTVKADFYPRPPRGGRRREVRIFQRWYQISIHALREEGDGCSISCIAASGISIHALREEGDAHIYIDPIFPIEPFLSTPSARRATAAIKENQTAGIQFLSTPSARRATLPSTRRVAAVRHFYPRPPRGGRRKGRSGEAMQRAISIHALREEGDRLASLALPYGLSFLSTPSARRATWSRRRTLPNSDFYPRPPRGGRRICPIGVQKVDISIHALREEGDPARISFLPRPPRISIHALREEGDLLHVRSAQAFDISIHALREEGDEPTSERYIPSNYFYPRPPRGGRPVVFKQCGVFQRISIHALREEGDRVDVTIWFPRSNFYPRPPRGGRHAGEALRVSGVVISIHALREEGDGHPL